VNLSNTSHINTNEMQLFLFSLFGARTLHVSDASVAAVTVYSAPDDGRKGRPKHIEF